MASTYRIHVWHIYPHVDDLYVECRYTIRGSYGVNGRSPLIGLILVWLTWLRQRRFVQHPRKSSTIVCWYFPNHLKNIISYRQIRSSFSPPQKKKKNTHTVCETTTYCIVGILHKCLYCIISRFTFQNCKIHQGKYQPETAPKKNPLEKVPPAAASYLSALHRSWDEELKAWWFA